MYFGPIRSPKNQRPRPESHVETLFKQTALACILCMCVHPLTAGVQTTGMGFKQEVPDGSILHGKLHLRSLDIIIIIMDLCRYIPFCAVQDVSRIFNSPQQASLASNDDSHSHKAF